MAEPLPVPDREPDGPETASDRAWNRRVWQRLTAWDLPPLSARLMSVGDVRVLDMSRGGARVQSTHRLLPGTTVAMLMLTGEGTLLIRGRILRARLVRFDEGGLSYEAAVAFDEALDSAATPGLAAAGLPALGPASASQPTIDMPAATPAIDASRGPADDASGDAARTWPSMLTLRANLSTMHDDLMAMLDDNNW